MLFDERPKARREDLFDRVKEVSEVIDAIDKGQANYCAVRHKEDW